MPDNLYERNGRFYARLYVGGQEHRRSLRTSSRQVALRRVETLRKELEKTAANAERVTFKQAVVQWDETFLSSENVKPSTRRRYLTSLKALAPAFEELFLDEITRKAIGAFVAERGREGVKNATIRRDLTALSTVFTCAIALGWTDHNPAKEWDRGVIKERRPPQKPPSLEQIEVVAGYARRSARDLTRFCAMVGCRINEAATLEWPEVNLKRGTVEFLKTKTSRPRTIRLATPGGDAAALLKARDRHNTGTFVFWHDEGEPHLQFSHDFVQLMKRAIRLEAKAGRKLARFRLHDLRHAFAIRWLKAGGDIYELSRHLGHSSVKTTEGYLQWMDPE